LDVEPDWLYLAQRLGDTESLCSVLSVELVEGELKETEAVRTRFPTIMDRTAAPISGPHAIVRMCDEERRLRPYVVPCEIRMEKTEAGVIPMVRPSEVEVLYAEPVEVVEGGEGLVLTAFWPGERPRRRRGRR